MTPRVGSSSPPQNRGITAIRSVSISDAERMEVFASYGWLRGNVGRFTDDRTLALARLAVREHKSIDPKFRYDAELIADIQRLLSQFDAIEVEAGTGERETAVHERNQSLEKARETLGHPPPWFQGSRSFGVKSFVPCLQRSPAPYSG